MQQKYRHIKSFVLRQGKITHGQLNAIDTLQPKYGIKYQPKDLPIQKLLLSPKNAPINIIMAKITMSKCPLADSPPATNNSESPGRNGVTTKPVSAKITRNNIA